ncbi:MAG: histidine kinase, partial [Bacteroidota bacterium]
MIKALLSHLTVFILCSFYTFGQTELDSVLLSLEQEEKNEMAIDALYDYLYSIELQEPEKAYKLYGAGSKLSSEIGYELGQAKGVAYQGAIHYNQAEWDQALEKYFESLGLVDTSVELRHKAAMFNNIGNVYNVQGDFFMALDYLQKASLLFEAVNDTFSTIINKNNTGSLFMRTMNPVSGKRVLNEALSLAKVVGDPYFLSDTYTNLGNASKIEGNGRESLSFYQLAHPNYVKVGDPRFLAMSFGNIADGFYQLGELDSVEYYASKGRNLVDQHNLPQEKAYIYAQYSLALSAKGSYRQGLSAAKTSLNLYDQIKNPVMESFGLRAMISALRGLKEYKEASLYSERYINLRDSLNSIEKNEQLLMLRTQFETEQKEKEIAVLEKEQAISQLALQRSRTLNIGAALGIGIVGLIAFFLVRTSRQAQKIADQDRELEAQKVKDLEKQQKIVALNATFKGQEEERIRIAKDLHDGLGTTLAAVKMRIESMDHSPVEPNFKNTTTEMVNNAYGEVRRIAHNMSPYSLNKFGLVKSVEKLCEEVKSSGKIETNFQALRVTASLPTLQEAMIYRILQELMNNILKHAKATEVQ